MSTPTRTHLASLGAELSPPMVEATQRHFAQAFAGMHPDTVVTRDHAYGPDERHRLDIFTRTSTRNAPVLVFVHGGGFIMGDKRMPGLPFYDNVGDFAARSGMVGVTMTYRLAPAHPWPAGSEDVASAIAWLHTHVAALGGDPKRVFVMGQSAGAVHVAGYVADGRRHEGARIAGALMVSGIYDVARAETNPFHLAYYGQARESWASMSTLDALVATDLPLFFSVSELDAREFQTQAGLLVAAFNQARHSYPQLHWLAGHNHLSPVLAIGSPLDALGALIQQFIAGLQA
jgi:triacylglycerol lipase